LSGERMLVLLNCFVACNESHEFTCENGKCFGREDVCDYFDKCGDSSDERQCSYPPGEFYVHSERVM